MSEKVEEMTGVSSVPLVSPEFEAGLEMLAKRSPEALRATLPLLEAQVNSDLGVAYTLASIATAIFTGSMMSFAAPRSDSTPLVAVAAFIFSVALIVGTGLWISGGRRTKSASDLAAVKMAIAIDERGEEIVRRVSAGTTLS